MSKKQAIPKPVTSGIADVPVIMQYENQESGAVSLSMVLGYYGKWLAGGKVKEDVGPCRDGANAYHIAKAAQSYGLNADVQKIKSDEFFQKASFPCIVHWQYTHFLVVKGVKKGDVYINDPKKGDYRISKKAFEERYTGFCIFFNPSESFKPEGHRKTLSEFIKERLNHMSAALFFVLLTTFLISMLTIFRQGMARLFVDRLMTGEYKSWEKPFLYLLSALTIIDLIVQAIKAYYMNRINGKISVVSSTSYMWHVLKMPLSFFSSRLTGDISFRKKLNVEVAGKLVTIFGPLVLQIVMMILYLGIMVSYSVILAIIGVASVLINAIIGRVIAIKITRITREQMTSNGIMGGTLSAGIQMIETIKASGAENGYFELWSGYQANVVAQQNKANKVNQHLGMIPQIVSGLTGNLVLIVGALLIMNGHFTPGSLMAFQGILTLFTAPANALIGFRKDLQEMHANMERIDDVMETEEDITWKRRAAKKSADETYNKLSGQLTMKDVSFGYSRLDDPLIENFNLDLKPGKSVAFVGPSGCGKSTLAKLISGLYQPWNGTISFDGKQLLDIDNSVFRGSLAVVDQDIILFEDSIENNIKMWDNTIENFEMILAARDAQIHYDIMKREDGYRHKLAPEGKDFSGGERQRLEIARVLAQEPTIIILDEATSALDAKTEFDVVKGIKDRGITCIVIAHRLSTIRSCDEIIVLDHGHVMERGTHNELLKKDGLYAELVKSE
ncbi:MAG: ATP-binding cassette domain-containing protein [Sphaerochaetaceae bacterium]|nr:ATP-binding cassette domain-containing protein [Sphaerochaetaceae bacterium]